MVYSISPSNHNIPNILSNIWFVQDLIPSFFVFNYAYVRSDGFVAKSLRPESQVIRDITNTIGNKTIYRNLFFRLLYLLESLHGKISSLESKTRSITGPRVSSGTPAPSVVPLWSPISGLPPG